MKPAQRIVVVGGGIIGAAVFHRLSREYGEQVLLVEQARRPAGASAASGGILRVFHLDPATSEEALFGVRFYQELEALPIRRTGFLTLLGQAQLDAARAQFERLDGRTALEWLSGAQAAALLGSEPDPAVVAGVYEPEAGYVDVVALAALLVRLGQAKGGQVLEGVAVQGVSAAGGVLRALDTGAGRIACANAVLCTGAWTPALADRLGVTLAQPLRAKVIQINRVRAQAALPAFVDLTTEVYGRPDDAGVLIGSPVDCWDRDADVVEEPAPGQYLETVRRGARRFPWLDGAQVLGGSRRQDAYSESGRGAVDAVPGVRGLLVASGYSGGGVKLAPSAAEQVAAHLIQPEELRHA